MMSLAKDQTGRFQFQELSFSDKVQAVLAHVGMPCSRSFIAEVMSEADFDEGMGFDWEQLDGVLSSGNISRTVNNGNTVYAVEHALRETILTRIDGTSIQNTINEALER